MNFDLIKKILVGMICVLIAITFWVVAISLLKSDKPPVKEMAQENEGAYEDNSLNDVEIEVGSVPKAQKSFAEAAKEIDTDEISDEEEAFSFHATTPKKQKKSKTKSSSSGKVTNFYDFDFEEEVVYVPEKYKTVELEPFKLDFRPWSRWANREIVSVDSTKDFYRIDLNDPELDVNKFKEIFKEAREDTRSSCIEYMNTFYMLNGDEKTYRLMRQLLPPLLGSSKKARFYFNIYFAMCLDLRYEGVDIVRFFEVCDLVDKISRKRNYKLAPVLKQQIRRKVHDIHRHIATIPDAKKQEKAIELASRWLDYDVISEIRASVE
ncbi:MAG: hypothetical protein MK193_04100 [Lentisphaeria bacterium]|nr:hypothetical protein [Lentisphaeria bacterium]